MSGFTHFDNDGNAIMADVSKKQPTERKAIAEGHIAMSSTCLQAVTQGTVTKGDVLGVARVAGIMAVKQTGTLIPLCHPLPIHFASVDFEIKGNGVTARCEVKTFGVTGVEMEALTGVSTALLTIYDMCKAIDKSMVIGGIRLLEKTGGKSGRYTAPEIL